MDTALRAVMDGAWSLTRASHASIISPDASGLVEDNLVLGTEGCRPFVCRPLGPAYICALNRSGTDAMAPC